MAVFSRSEGMPSGEPSFAATVVASSHERVVLERLLTAARRELGMDVAYFSAFIQDSQVVRQTVGDGSLFDLHAGTTIPLEQTYCRRVAEGALPEIIPDTGSNQITCALPVTSKAGIGSYVGVPITFSDGHLYGTLCCASRDANPSLAERDVAFMHVLARMVAESLERDRHHDADRERLERAVMMSAADIADSHAEMLRRLSMALEYRDDDTGAHVNRVGDKSAELAALVGLGETECEMLRAASKLHDAGKVAIPDAVLLKPGRLTAEERAIVETHTDIGHALLKDSKSAVLRLGAMIAWTHHEKFDGTGYPRGLAGEEIPIEGRIVAIADVYDALRHDRVYRPAFSRSRALEMMHAERGRHFDPVLLDLFMRAESVGTLPDF